MHIPDMQALESGRVAIGWLYRDHSFPAAPTAPEFLTRLKEFAGRYGDSEALGWGAMGGWHTCEFCGKALGFGSFGVPADGRLFYAPDMIAHYVEEHGYAPPEMFIAAVLECPLPGTAEYVEAVRPFTEKPA